MPITQIPRKKRRVAPSGRTSLHLRNRVPSTLAPVEAPEFAPVRVLVLGVTIVGAFVLLILRLWFLQVVNGQAALEEAEGNQRTSIRIQPPRGIIEDRNREPLITNTSRIDVFMVPDRLDEWVRQEMRKVPRGKRDKGLRERLETEAYQRLVDALEDGTAVAELKKTFKKNQQPGPSDPTLVKQDISQAQLARIAEGLADLPGVIPQSVPVRRYPKGKLAAQVLGYIKQISPEGWKAEQEALEKARLLGEETENLSRHRQTDFVGAYGLEKYYDKILAGEPGSTDYAITAQGKRLKVVETREAIPGAKLTLTLDSKLQAIAERTLQGKKGAIVAIDPRDGSVLALCSYPSFDPAAFQRSISKGDVAALNAGQNEWATNPWLPPGSPFKIITAAAGLMEEKIFPGTSYACAGGYKKLRCHSSRGHGVLGVRGALAQSCDVFFYHVGERLKETKLKEWAIHFGLGQKTGIDLPEDPQGVLSTSAAKKRKNDQLLKDARKRGDGAAVKRILADGEVLNAGEVMQTAIGQGLTGTSPLHVALMTCAAANKDGLIFRPHFLRYATASDGSGARLPIPEATPRVAYKPPVSPEVWKVVREGMRAVVTSGTARRTANSSVCYIAGKTGTAETGKKGQTHAWFTGYGARNAASAPSIVVTAFLFTDGKNLHGGDHAAPLARQVIEAHFGKKGASKPPVAVSSGGD